MTPVRLEPASDFIWDFGKLPFPTHLGKYFIKIGKIRAKIHEIGKIKAIFGLGMTPIYGLKNSQIKSLPANPRSQLSTLPLPLPPMRVNSASSQVGLSQVGPVISYIAYYSPRYFHKRYQYEVFFIYKNVQQKFEGIMFVFFYIAGLSILFHSTGLTS